MRYLCGKHLTDMIKHTILAFSLLFLTVCAAAQVTIERNWKKGDFIEVTTQQARVDDGEESLDLDEMDITQFTVEVIDETKDFFLCELKMDNLFEEMAQEMGEDNGMDMDFDKLRYECRFYKNDPRFEVTNAKEISAFMENTIGMVMDLMEKESEDDEDGGGEAAMGFIRLMFEGLMEPYRDEQKVTEMMAQQLSFLIDPYIENLSGEKISTEIMCPNPFKPGEEVKAMRSSWLENHDEKAGSAEVVSTLDMDMSAMIANMMTMVEEMAKMFKGEDEEWTEEDEAKLEEQREEIRAMKMDATMQERVVMDLKTGWPVRIEQSLLLDGQDHNGPRNTAVDTTIEIKKIK